MISAKSSVIRRSVDRSVLSNSAFNSSISFQVHALLVLGFVI